MKTNVNIVKDVPLVNVNLVPCKIQYTGPSNTEEFFTPSKKSEKWQEQDVVTASFRGLKFIGENIELKNKVGYICNSTETLEMNPDEPEKIETLKELKPVAKFEGITVYGHDSRPSENNKWKLLNEWDAVAEAIHA